MFKESKKYLILKTKHLTLIPAIVVVLVGLSLGLPRLRQSPAFVHAWAQADRYALAVGFTENGHDLFHPETKIYNKQFPHKWKVDDGSTVTAVDLPLHEYVVSLLMLLCGTTAPWVFRGFTLLVSLVGVWFLFLMAYRLTGDSLKSLLVTLVALTSPLYVYYFANYLPSAPALAFAMAGLWAYVRYYQDDSRCQECLVSSGKCLVVSVKCSSAHRFKDSQTQGLTDSKSHRLKDSRNLYWHVAVGLVAMATLVRTSYAVLLIALCAFEALRILHHETTLWNKVPSLAVAALAIAGYMLWNRHLREAYGSVFLSQLMPPRSWEDVTTVFDEMHWHWRFEYFTRLQHWLVAVACVAAVVLLVIRKRRGGSLSLGWFATIWWLGEMCFFVAMLRQYQNHDYYFLDSFFLPALFTFILALRVLPAVKGHLPGVIALVALVALGCVMYGEATRKVSDRCWEGDRAYITSQHFQGSDRWLDEQGVSRDARILAFLAYPQNGPLLQMGRKGYTVMNYDEGVVDAAMGFPYDYAVMENDHITEETLVVLQHWDLIADNGTLSLFKKKQN